MVDDAEIPVDIAVSVVAAAAGGWLRRDRQLAVRAQPFGIGFVAAKRGKTAPVAARRQQKACQWRFATHRDDSAEKSGGD